MVGEGDDVAATMKDLKELKGSLTSLVDTRMDELRELIAQLGSARAAAPPASSSPHEDSSENVNGEDDEGDDGETGTKGDGDKENEKAKIPKKSSSSDGKGKEEGYHAVPPTYSPDPPVPHPHINSIGVPPKIDASSSFSQWQYLMRTFLRSSCNELWRIVQKGFKPFDLDNLTRKEVVGAQLDSMALLILQQAVGPKELPHIQKVNTAKETWDALEERFLGNDSMRRNRYEELCNEAEEIGRAHV